MISDMLLLASSLAESGIGPGRPKGVELRRAVSTAYYALFHSLARLCAAELVGWSKPWDVVTPVYRSLDHRRARDVLNDFRKFAPGSALASVSLAFSQLQDARHEADYDPRPFQFKRSGAIDLIDTARQAVVLLDQLSPEARLTLAVRLIARSR